MDQESKTLMMKTPGRVTNNLFAKSNNEIKMGFSDYGFSHSSYKAATSEFQELNFKRNRNLSRDDKTVSSFSKLNDFDYLNY
jgi:hypothetical protein